MNYEACQYCKIKSQENCNKCTEDDRDDILENHDDDEFWDSFLIGAVTGSTVLGAALGGSILGGFLGDSIFGDDDDDFF